MGEFCDRRKKNGIWNAQQPQFATSRWIVGANQMEHAFNHCFKVPHTILWFLISHWNWGIFEKKICWNVILFDISYVDQKIFSSRWSHLEQTLYYHRVIEIIQCSEIRNVIIFFCFSLWMCEFWHLVKSTL